MRDVYVRDDFSSAATGAIKAKISMTPILFTAKVLEPHNIKAVYPIINWNERDAYREMIVGQDCPAQWEVLNAGQFDPRELKPTPGPSFSPTVGYMGHNIALVHLSDFPTPPDEFFEYLCYHSDTISRLAVNKATSKMAVMYKDSATVHQYDQVPAAVFHMLDIGAAAREEAMRMVKEACSASVLEEFPDAVLTNVDKL
jgi:hypothetical protein